MSLPTNTKVQGKGHFYTGNTSSPRPVTQLAFLKFSGPGMTEQGQERVLQG